MSFIMKLFHYFDLDGDGLLDFTELIYGLGPLLKGPLSSLLQLFYNLGKSDLNAMLDLPAFQETVEILSTLYTSPWPTFEEAVQEDVDQAETILTCRCYNEFASQLANHYPALLASIERKLSTACSVEK